MKPLDPKVLAAVTGGARPVWQPPPQSDDPWTFPTPPSSKEARR